MRNCLCGNDQNVAGSFRKKSRVITVAKSQRHILHFAASKKHIGFYPGPAAVVQFSKELQEYKTDKGTIQIPYGKVDAALIEKIAKWCLETGNHA